MNNRKIKIEFHPRRLSHSNSKDKYSPYRKQKTKQKYLETQENVEKMNLHEPIIKFKHFMENPYKEPKLKLNNQQIEDPRHTCTTHFSNYFYNNAHPNQQNAAIQQLIQKIDEQHQSMKQNFQEINQKLRLPKISGKEENQLPQDIFKKYENMQQKIVYYLEILTQVNKENSELKSQLQKYEVQIMNLQQELETTKNQCLWLLQELSTLKMLKLIESEETQLPKKENFIEKASSSSNPRDQAQENQTVKPQPNLINDYEELLRKKEEEINHLKLQHQILTEEIKLLNYTIEEKDNKLKNQHQKDLVKENKEMINCETEEPNFLSSGENITSQNEASNMSIESEKDNIIFKHSIRTKKTNSFLVAGGQTLKDLEELNIKFQRKQKRRRTSSDKGTKQQLNDRVSLSPKALNRFSMSFDLIKKKQSQTDKHKIDMGRSFLKNKAKGLSQSKVKNKQKWIWHFDKSNMHNLEIIRTTIGFKLRGFRFNFADLSSELLNKKSQSISREDIKKYLEDQPFLLSDHLISIVENYIFKNIPATEPKIKVDDFCKHLRQLIPDYDICPEEIQKVAVEKINMLIESSWQNLTSQLQHLCQVPGLIGHKALKTVLKQFNMGELEIELIISQCCMISSDCQHLNYQQYFLLFHNQESMENSF